MFKAILKGYRLSALVTVLLFGAVFGPLMYRPSKTVDSKPVDAMLVVKNTQALNDCLKDKPGCVGGYIRWPNGSVGRITNSASIYSDFEIGLDSIEIKMSLKEPWFPSTIEYVALPNTAAWDEAVKEYGKQFIVRR